MCAIAGRPAFVWADLVDHFAENRVDLSQMCDCLAANCASASGFHSFAVRSVLHGPGDRSTGLDKNSILGWPTQRGYRGNPLYLSDLCPPQILPSLRRFSTCRLRNYVDTDTP